MNLTPTRLKAVAIAASLAVIGALSAPAVAGTMPQNEYSYIYENNASTTREARSVGSLTIGWDQDSDNVVRGSGVLVGGRYVLTAAHLIDDSVAGVFTIGGQNYNIESFVVANQFYGRDPETTNPNLRAFGSGADIALIRLDRRVSGARNRKAKINRWRNEAGKTATIVGYGRGGSGNQGINDLTGADFSAGLSESPDNNAAGEAIQTDYLPTLRVGKNVIEPNGPFGALTRSNRELATDFDPDPNQLNLLDVNIPFERLNPFTGEVSIDEDDIPITGEYAPAVGDSGGGLFINGKLAGITSWTSRANSEYFSQAFYTRMSVGWWKWVRDNIKAYNNYARNPTATPWLKVSKGGNGFRGVAKINHPETVEDDDGNIVVREGQPEHIFGPGLFYELDIENGTYEHFDVASSVTGLFIANDAYAVTAPLPEPTSLALLSLGGLAMIRRAKH